MAVDESGRNFTHPLYNTLRSMTGLSIGTTTADSLLTWGAVNSMFIFPMATSCCAIEFMTSAASRVDIDQMGAVVRPSPRHSDVMVVAGTITVKMAPRVKKLWDQMPEPKWCIAMGSCAISGDFYRDIYSVVPGVDVIVPVDVYIPGCPPNPDQVMVGLKRLQDKIRAQRAGTPYRKDEPPTPETVITPSIPALESPDREESLSQAQHTASRSLGMGGNEQRRNDTAGSREGIQPTEVTDDAN